MQLENSILAVAQGMTGCVNANPQELVRWDGVLTRDGVRGGSKGGILRRFDRSRDDNTALDKDTCGAMTKTRWLELDCVCKLCNNATSPKRGQPGCDPAHKFNFICDVIAANVNSIDCVPAWIFVETRARGHSAGSVRQRVG